MIALRTLAIILLGVLVGCSPQVNPLADAEETNKTAEDNTLRDSQVWQPAEKSTKGAEVNREDLPKEDGEEPKLSELTIHLDQGKINRVNARRDPAKLTTNPELFGVEKIFKPLVSMVVIGPGKVYIEGDGPTGQIEFGVDPKKEKIEIYPHYNLQALFGGTEYSKEKINVFFEPKGKEKVMVDSVEVGWSGPREVFLSDKNLSDLASLAEDDRKIDKAPSTENLDLWLQKTAAQLATKSITYVESSGNEAGWQKIKKPEDIDTKRTANCLEMVLWLAAAAEEAGFDGYLITTDGHALVGLSPQGEGLGSAKYVETTLLIKQPNQQTSTLEQALSKGEEEVRDKMKEDQQKILAIGLEEWKTYYRDRPKP